MRLYQFAVLKHPTEEDRKKGDPSKVIVPPGEWELAKSEDEVIMKATRAIPGKHMKDADRLEVAVHPFG